MENNGWIIIHRKITENTLYFAETFDKTHAWIDLLILASFKNRDFFLRGIKIEQKRGQVAESLDFLSQRWKWSKNKVIRYLKILEKEGQIELQKSNVINLISIVNYDKYQIDETTNETANRTANETANETTYKESNNKSNKEKDKEKETLRVSKKKDELSFSDQETPSTSNLFEQDSTVQETNVDVNVYKEKELNEKKKKLNCLPPATEVEVQQYCDEKGITNVDCIKFVAYYSSNGWRVGKNPMKNWHSAVSLWSRNNSEKNNNNTSNTTKKYPDYVYELPPAEKKRRQLMGIP